MFYRRVLSTVTSTFCVYICDVIVTTLEGLCVSPFHKKNICFLSHYSNPQSAGVECLEPAQRQLSKDPGFQTRNHE